MGSIVHRSVPTNLKWLPNCSHAHALFQDRFKDVQVGSRWFSTLYILSPNFHTKRKCVLSHTEALSGFGSVRHGIVVIPTFRCPSAEVPPELWVSTQKQHQVFAGTWRSNHHRHEVLKTSTQIFPTSKTNFSRWRRLVLGTT